LRFAPCHARQLAGTRLALAPALLPQASAGGEGGAGVEDLEEAAGGRSDALLALAGVRPSLVRALHAPWPAARLAWALLLAHLAHLTSSLVRARGR